MLNQAKLESVFQIWWDEMEKCKQFKAYWALLHMTVCLPDICGALESDDGIATKENYENWVNANFCDKYLNGGELYQIRCNLLHQGRSISKKNNKRYKNYIFLQPDTNGNTIHAKHDKGELHIDVGNLSDEMIKSMKYWISTLSSHPKKDALSNVETNILKIVKIREIPISGIISYTNILATSSSMFGGVSTSVPTIRST